jgi:hypothetical protein
MQRRFIVRGVALLVAAHLLVSSAEASPFFFSTGSPDGLIGTLSRPSAPGQIQTETADDFIISQPTRLDSATFTGLLPTGAPLSSVTRVEIELYRVFPLDSTNPPSGHVPMRTNSPGDVEVGTDTRDSVGGSLSFITTFLNTSFTVNNSVVNGIHASPGQTTGGEGPVAGEEVLFSVAFNPGILLPADHYFFRPEVQLSNGNFLWLSAPKPITSGTPFSPDLQSWTRNDTLAPDWLRIGTDIVGGSTPPTYNAAFSLSGEIVPEPNGLLAAAAGLVALILAWHFTSRGDRRSYFHSGSDS